MNERKANLVKKRIVTIALVVALLATCIGGVTLAYLTDKDEKINTFTVGNVDIILHESKLHRDNDDATDEQIIEDAKTYGDYLAEAGKNMVPGRWVKKAPYVENVGKNAAYIRVTVVQSGEIWDTTSLMEYTTAQDEGKIVASTPAQNSDGDWVITYTYTEALEPGELTYYAPFWQFKINDNLDNDDLENLTAEGVINSIYVYAEAIQAEGFADYVAAFAAFDAQKNSQ